ncbi:MAG: DUF4297 domain-containing protein [Candidatus Schekmanbacteria bacterium]|nr:DUF4297 domain-containing protein [Candidatus Schekmanbacteria bacterium]
MTHGHPGTPKDSLPSLRQIPPADQGGRISRQGFDYQDHVGAAFCLAMHRAPALQEIWFESHDDLVICWNDQQATEVFEFVQVKNENLRSRYSVAAISRREQGAVGTSLAERSLNRSRCRERTQFRLVTSYDTDDELEPLKVPLADRAEPSNAKRLGVLKQALLEKLSDASPSQDGTTIDAWLDRCLWDKRPDTIDALRALNLLELEALLQSAGHDLPPDMRDELYSRLLALVKQMSGPGGANDFRLSRQALLTWMEQAIANLREGPATLSKLAAKLEAAGLRETFGNASDLYWAYRRERLSPRYSDPRSLMRVEQDVTAELNLLKSRLDIGRIQGGPAFHNACLEALEQLRAREEHAGQKVSFAYLQGYMYFRTNRCVHRFMEARP